MGVPAAFADTDTDADTAQQVAEETCGPSNKPTLVVLREDLGGPRAAQARPSSPRSATPATPLSLAERDALYAELQPLVRRLMRQYGDTYEMRQDMEGEIYCRYCELLDAYDPSRGVPLRAYVVRKLISSVYTFARSQWRRRRHEVSLDLEVELSERPGQVNPSAEWDQELMKKELLKALPSAIAGLPVRQRQVVIWRYYEGRSYDEIAEMLGICQATVRSLMRHGLNNLRRQVSLTRLALD